jgi:dihydrodipicolinate synthase/N-acetylneuraminate lyase
VTARDRATSAIAALPAVGLDALTTEAALLCELGYHAGLLSLGALCDASEDEMIAHCRAVAEIIPVVGFYLQPSVGGRVLPNSFWRRFAEIDNVVAIKIAPFNRYQTLDVIRAVMEAGREDITLYTGNDDNIVVDLLTRFRFPTNSGPVDTRITGGLLGHWGVWTRSAVNLFNKIQAARGGANLDEQWLSTAIAVTDMNAAVFDTANTFAGCIPGILEVLRRQGLVPTNLCLNPHETLSPGQAAELDRVSLAYPELTDDGFVAENLHRWLTD